LTLWKLGENDEAMRHLNNAISLTTSLPEGLYRQLLQIELNTTLGDVALGQSKPDESVTYYKSAIQAIKNNNNRVYLSSIHQGMATAYLAMGQIPKAETEFQTSISLAERDRRQIKDAGSRSMFLASRQSVYRTMVDLQFNTKHDPVAAFDYAEIGKSRSLLDTFSGKTVTGWQDGQVKLSLFGNAHPLKLKQIQHALPQDIQLLFYSVTEKKVMIWLITSDNTVTASVDYNATRLQKAISEYLADLRARREINLINRRSAELYQLLIAPVAAKLDRDRLLCIIPDATLYQLPFAALFSSQSNHYLIEDYSITFAPSASVLIKTMKLAAAKSSGAPESFFGIGNPRFNSSRFQGLPNLAAAGEEISRSRSLYQQSEYFSKEDATESEVVRRMGSHEIAHIASHILINERSPLLSSIVLAEEKATKVQEKAPLGVVADGALQAQEIYQMSFPKTKLMILSGCRSAAGTYANGEALGALAQSFFAAKVPAVIASLWEVDDASSAEIMYSFHYNHRVKHQSFGEALSQAQRSVIHSSNTRRQHPYYWAAFLLSGDGRLNTTSLN
jgi:CHAT domain-containing protein